MRILIKYATRSRPEWFKQAINNILDTYRGDILNLQILVSADIDDEKMRNNDIIEFVNSKNKGLNYFKIINLIYGPSKSKIDAINRDMDLPTDWQLLINMSDDMHFVQDGWDETLIRRIQGYWGDNNLDFFAHFNDGYVGDKLATMSVMGRTYYERDGYIYYPEYKSFSCDAEAWFVARARGCHHYFSDILFLHQHPTHSPMPQDELYHKNSLATPDDLKVYWRRLNSDFDLKIPGPFPWDEFKTNQK